MSLPDSSIDPKILESARVEFLQKGFKDASLRNICEKAGVTTGALYKRFTGKEALFDALVKPTLQDIADLSAFVEKYNYEYLDKGEMQRVWDMSEETHRKWIEFFYARFEGMKLLLCRAEGSNHSGFLHAFVLENTRHTLAFAEEARRRGRTDKRMDEDELHILLTAYWSSLLEPIVHDFPKEKALHYCGIITKFFNWQAIFGF